MTDVMMETSVTGAEVERLIGEKLLPQLEGEEKGLAVIALLTLTLSLMKEDLTAEELTLGVRGASEWMCLFLAATAEQGLPAHEKRLLN